MCRYHSRMNPIKPLACFESNTSKLWYDLNMTSTAHLLFVVDPFSVPCPGSVIDRRYTEQRRSISYDYLWNEPMTCPCLGQRFVDVWGKYNLKTRIYRIRTRAVCQNIIGNGYPNIHRDKICYKLLGQGYWLSKSRVCGYRYPICYFWSIMSNGNI